MADNLLTGELKLISDAKTTLLADTLYVVLISWLCYDHLLTLNREMSYIWPRGISSSTILFYSIRYLALVVVACKIFILVPFKDKSDQSCSAIIRLELAMGVVIPIASTLFSALRAYALYGRKIAVLVVVLLLGIVNPAVTLYILVALQITGGSSSYECTFNLRIPSIGPENYLVVARTCTVLADILVLVVTWMRTSSVRSRSVHAFGIIGFSEILFTDGIIYFVALLSVHVIGLVLSRNDDMMFPILELISVFTIIFTNRFILDLHEVAARLYLGSTNAIPTLIFSPETADSTTLDIPAGGSVYGTSISWDTLEDYGEDEDASLSSHALSISHDA